MKLVIDANVIIAMLIKPGKPIDLFLNAELDIFAPRLLLEELEKNRDIISSKSDLDETEINALFDILISNIRFVREREFVHCREQAESICPDPDDVTYFALSLFLDCPLWTNDKKLKSQETVKVYATHELVELFGIS
ncbi:hypothetical protein KY362_01685 [Candidatus Woesearchaeota archaeon]|nr:hypothetical protein [Candidatus Woesearchaeota archaeon]